MNTIDCRLAAVTARLVDLVHADPVVKELLLGETDVAQAVPLCRSLGVECPHIVVSTTSAWVPHDVKLEALPRVERFLTDEIPAQHPVEPDAVAGPDFPRSSHHALWSETVQRAQLIVIPIQPPRSYKRVVWTKRQGFVRRDAIFIQLVLGGFRHGCFGSQ